MDNEPNKQPSPPFWEDGSGDVPVVNPADLRTVWNVMRENATPGLAMGTSVFERACRPGADVKAVWFRAAMLQMLPMMVPGWIPTNSAFVIAARFSMKKMETGVPGQPFDVQQFLNEVEAQSR